MRKPTSTPAKVNVPLLRSVYERPRLYARIDAANPVIWISASPGSGKTALVASYIQARNRPCLWYQADEGDNDLASFFYYLGLAAKKAAPRTRRPLPVLTPEYLPGLATFARRYFEALVARLPYGTLVVIDEYQTLGADSPLHEFILNSFEQIPAGMNLIIISRESPPANYARALLHRTLTLIDSDELCLTEEEAYEFAQKYLKGEPSRATVGGWHMQTQGWMAGMVLAFHQQSAQSPSLHAASSQVMFDYFAKEIFDHIATATQQLLLMSAFVPIVSVAIAQELSGLPDAAERLEWLRRKNYFISRRANDNSYEYHPLFGEFLRARARASFSKDELIKVKRQAARLLEQGGEIEAAAALLQAAQDGENLTRLFVQQAPVLLAKGRGQTLQTWFSSLPQEYQEHPWPRYWRGMSCLLLAPQAAQQDFAQAYAGFEAAGDALGQCLSWSGVADSFLYAWDDFTGLDPWIARLEDLFENLPAFSSPDIELRVSNSALGALLWRQPQHARLPLLITRLEVLLLQTTDHTLRVMVGTNLLNYHTWRSDLNKSLSLIARLHLNVNPQSPRLLILWQWVNENTCYWVTGDFEGCARLAAKGIEFGGHHGILIFEFAFLTQSIFALIGSSELTRAAEALTRAEALLNPQRRLDVAHFHFVAGWLALRQGDVVGAEYHARLAVSLTDLMGAVFPRALSQIALAQVLIMREEYPAARPYLNEAHRLGREMDTAAAEYMALLSEAYLALRGQDEPQALRLLREALALGRACRIINPPWWMPELMSPLLALALKAGIEVEFARELIRTLKLTPHTTSADTEHWPWPIRIYTFGHFKLVRDNKPIQFAGRTQKRALDLLKALIAYGGREVSELKLCDHLWPDAEADNARASFKMTLHRLRGLIGQDAVTLSESKLSLDPAVCWVDAWAFDAESNRLTTCAAALSTTELERLGERMLRLYSGPFLGDEEPAFALATRERLRGKWMRALAAIAETCQRDNACDQALVWYERGIDVEPLAEPFYQGLMRIFLASGRAAEGLAVYERLRRILSSGLQISPAPATVALAHSLSTISA